MKKKGSAVIVGLVVVIILLVSLGGYFGYKLLSKSKQINEENSGSSEENLAEDFGLGIWDCEIGGSLGGSHPIIGYGGGDITGIEAFDLPTVGEIDLCCIDFKNLDEETYKVCMKKDEEGFTTHEIALDGAKKIYEIVPWQGLSCTYLYDDKGDWSRSCE